jgi:hypothetical protein
MNNEFNTESEWITELGKARSDEYTEKILAFVQEIEKSCPEPFIPLLTDLALARVLIVHLVIRYGLGLPPWVRQTVKTQFAVRCKFLDRQDHFNAF